jgi:signal peptidase I
MAAHMYDQRHPWSALAGSWRKPSSVLLGRNPRAALIRIAVIVVVAIVTFRLVLLPVRLQGISMLPTYSSGAIYFANRLVFWLREPARGDVVAIRMAGPSVLYVKRIVGLPRERIEIVQGVVLVGGEPLVEPNVVHRAPWNLPAFTVGDDEYFVVGDNRGMAMENHDFGRARRARIIGKLLF